MDKGAIENPKKTFWRDAATDGGVTGSILFAAMLLDDFTQHELTGALFIIKFIVLAACIYIFTRRRSLRYADGGFTFGHGMSFILAMMIFAGFITGIENYLAFNFIAPEYYQASFDILMKNNPVLEMLDADSAGEYTRTLNAALRNPLYFVASGIFGKILAGGLMGLLVSGMTKRPPISTVNNE